MENFENYDTYGLGTIKKTLNTHSCNKRRYLTHKFYSSKEQNSSSIKVILEGNELHIYEPDSEHSIKLAFNMMFIPLTENQKIIGFRIRVTRQEYYSFYEEEREIIEEWKTAFSKYISIWGFYEDYKPLTQIGKGKSASVFLAIRRKDSEKVAIKAFFKNEMKGQSRALDALENQIKILSRLSNPYIVKFIASYQTQKSYYLITQYIQGKTLKALLEDRPLAYHQSVSILKDIAIGLKYLAKQDIAHRDIKPDNIIISAKTMKPIIIDFGLATLCKTDKYIYRHCGTPGYVAPEILDTSQKSISPQVDIFSLGIIFHLMLFRRFPYTTKDVNQILHQNKCADFNFSSFEYLVLPEEGIKLLESMVRSSPFNRINAKKIIKIIEQKKTKKKEPTAYKKVDPCSVFAQNNKEQNRIKLLRSGSLDVFFKKRVSQILV